MRYLSIPGFVLAGIYLALSAFFIGYGLFSTEDEAMMMPAIPPIILLHWLGLFEPLGSLLRHAPPWVGLTSVGLMILFFAAALYGVGWLIGLGLRAIGWIFRPRPRAPG